MARDPEMLDGKTWEEFRSTGLLWWINMMLHTFGWAIVFNYGEDGTLLAVMPARVKYRGFGPKETERGYRKVSRYMLKNAKQLREEAEG